MEALAPPAKDILQTYTGKVLRPLDAWPGDFNIMDIAWSLAHQCRYNGHTKMFYSVATHSILVASFCPPELRLEGLLHDATEAYLSDLPSPLKRQMPEYQDVETSLASVIATQYHLVFPEHPAVKQADDYVFQLECGLVMGGAIAAKFALTDACYETDRNKVEDLIKLHAAAPFHAVVKDFLYVHSQLAATRGADIQAAGRVA